MQRCFCSHPVFPIWAPPATAVVAAPAAAVLAVPSAGPYAPPPVPSQPDAEREPPPPRTEPDEEPAEDAPWSSCLLITLGFNGRWGSELLRLWRERLVLVDWVIDVRQWLPRDVPLARAWGTHQSTQNEIRSRPCFEQELLPLVMGRCLLSSVVVLACTSGHHRSVATAEIAARELGRVGAPVNIEVVHVDATVTSSAQWERLCELQGPFRRRR